MLIELSFKMEVRIWFDAKFFFICLQKMLQVLQNSGRSLVVLTVKNMTSAECAGRVEQALAGIHGVKSVCVELERGIATVEGNASVESMVGVLSAAGYAIECSNFDAPLNASAITCHLTVKAMTCKKCVGRVERALRGVDGVVDVQVDLEHGIATICGSASVESLIKASNEAGYPASPAFPVDSPAESQAACTSPVRLAVDGMTCGKCVGRVERALRGVAGVTSATVQLHPGAAVVEGSASPHQLIAALEAAGYPARDAGPSATSRLPVLSLLLLLLLLL